MDVPVRKGQVMTKELKDNLEAQGMSSFDDLTFVELSWFLGRPCGPAERADGAYNTPATCMVGAKTAKKNGAPNVDAILATALTTGDIGPYNSWMLNLTQRCAVSTASPFASKAANLYSTFHSKALRLKDGRAIAWYCIEYRAYRVGRGIPDDSDPELLALAQNEAAHVALGSPLKDLGALGVGGVEGHLRRELVHPFEYLESRVGDDRSDER